MDFHCHLDLYPDAKNVYAETLRKVDFTWLVTTSPRAYAATARVLQRHARVSISPGLHPEIAKDKQAELPLLLKQLQYSQLVGEVGLDGSSRYRDYFDLQKRIFGAIVQRCEELGGRGLSIHSRAAAMEVLQTLQAHSGFGLAVLHWFTDSPTILRKAVSQGCWFSVGPAMLKSANGRKLVAQMPRDRVVPESDGPFAKDKGAPIMPWEAMSVSSGVSAAWGISQTEAEVLLRSNSERLLERMRMNPGDGHCG